jgi:3-methyladenine DNA glycosylase AlkD
MAKVLAQLRKELRQMADPARAENLQRFFKTGKGEYAEGDLFLGLTVPQLRLLMKKNWQEISISELQALLQSRYHEERMIALFILVAKFKKADEAGKPAFAKAMAGKKEIFDLYLANTKFINNWDLIDLSSPNIIGSYLYGKDSSILFKLARSKSLWERRIAMLSTFYSIGKGEPRLALEIAEILINDKHDLVHKACGWMLREVGKRCDQAIEEEFLEKHYKTMPRTMLRYAIERFDDKKRRYYLGKNN